MTIVRVISLEVGRLKLTLEPGSAPTSQWLVLQTAELSDAELKRAEAARMTALRSFAREIAQGITTPPPPQFPPLGRLGFCPTTSNGAACDTPPTKPTNTPPQGEEMTAKQRPEEQAVQRMRDAVRRTVNEMLETRTPAQVKTLPQRLAKSTRPSR